MRLLDLLAAHPEWVIEDGGERFTAREYVEEWEAGAGAADRGPEVRCLPFLPGYGVILPLDGPTRIHGDCLGEAGEAAGGERR